jgi:hypothetical protein
MSFRVAPICSLVAVLCVTACGRVPPEVADTSRARPQTGSTPRTSPDSVSLLNPRIPHAVAGDPHWEYARRAKADFNGDGRVETAVLIANAEVDARGIPLWDHGHSWQVYIEEADSTRTYVYAHFLPNGKLDASVTVPDEEKLPTIVLQENTPYTIGIYEVRYLGPQRVRSVRHLYRELDRHKWFEGSPRP